MLLGRVATPFALGGAAVGVGFLAGVNPLAIAAALDYAAQASYEPHSVARSVTVVHALGPSRVAQNQVTIRCFRR
jgi:hypothetical protein